MSVRVRPRHGSLQFYPRKRAAKTIPSANWKHISSSEQGLLGLIAYKSGMTSALVKDSTDKVRTSKKQLIIPVTILEAPAMKILSIRFYRGGRVLKEVVVSNEKELKRKIRLPKEARKMDKLPENYDDIRVIAYSLPKQTSIKKTPDLIELAVKADDKLEFVKSLIGKELTLENFALGSLIDVRGITKGKGTQGPVKRFGITLRFHKSEKGVRKVGSIGPWHPAHVTFRVPMAGQMGLHSRLIYNLHVLNKGKISDHDINPKSGFRHYGRIKTSYLIISGSVQGPVKRPLLVTPSFRPSKKQSKRKLEFLEVLNK